MYPKLSEKEWNRLPKIMQEVIIWDERDPRQEKVVNLSDRESYLESVAEWKSYKNQLNAGCSNFISKQRGGTGGAMS